MGVLNVTPDSFYDGGAYAQADVAIGRASEMVEEGARIIDVGGASSRPRGVTYGAGADVVPAEEEISRILPIIEGIAGRHPTTWISVDTYLPEVARAALAAGAHMVNDITGLRAHAELADAAAQKNAPLVVMHSVGRPGEMPHVRASDDIVTDVLTSLRESLDVAVRRGVSQIIVDPGFGFGKTVEDNMRLVGELDRLAPLDRPVLIGISRKSTIGAILGSVDQPVPVEDRLFGSLGAAAVATIRGAAILRTHDVRPTVEMLRVVWAALSR